MRTHANNYSKKRLIPTRHALALKKAARLERIETRYTVVDEKDKQLRTHKDFWDHQLQNFKFLWKVGCAALFLDMGLGKTTIILSWVKALINKRKIKRPVLLVGPIRVIYGVWAQEAQEWKHLRSLRFSIVHGTVAERLAALDVHADFYMINPESLVWLLRLFRSRRARANWPFDVLVIDESSMFKSVAAKRFRALRYFCPLFKHRAVCSGTPRPNSLIEIWTQMYIVDLGKRLGTSFDVFKNRFFLPVGEGNKYVPRRTSEKKIYKLIDDVAVTMKLSDWKTDTPPTLINPIVIDLPPHARALYDKFEKELFLKLDQGDVRAFNAASLTGKCQQIANGAIYTIERETETTIWEHVHDAKLEALRDVIDETGSPILAAYWFKHDLARLRHAFPDAAVFSRKNLDTLESEWNNNKHDLALAFPRTVAYGGNLQKGLGCTIAWFSLTWSYELFDQMNSRIGGARARRPVMVHQIIARNTIDEAMIISLRAKANGNSEFMSALTKYRRRKAA